MNRFVKFITGNAIFIFIALVVTAGLMHFLSLYLIFPGHYTPLAFHHSDFYTPAALSHSTGSHYSFENLLKWPRPLTVLFYKFTGYFGHAGSVAWIVAVVFINCALTALFARKLLNLKFTLTFYLFFVLYCYLLFTQPYFYTFYSQDIGSQFSYFLLLSGVMFFVSFFQNSNVLAFSLLFIFSSCAFLTKETYILSASFFAFCWAVYSYKKNFVKAILPGMAIFLSGVMALLFSFKNKSVFVNLDAKTGSDYHIDFGFLSVFKELSRYAGEAVTPFILLSLGFIVFQLYKNYQNKFFGNCALILLGFALLAWLPNALLPFHHYEGYSFNGLYVLFAAVFFVVKMLEDKVISKKILWVIVILLMISPLSSIKKYKGVRNTWVLAMEKVQINMLASFTKGTAQLLPLERNITVLVTGITSPFHPFAFPESLRSFAGGDKATYYFVVVKEFPERAGTTKDLVHYITENEVSSVVYDQQWVFDGDGNMQIHDAKNTVKP